LDQHAAQYFLQQSSGIKVSAGPDFGCSTFSKAAKTWQLLSTMVQNAVWLACPLLANTLLSSTLLEFASRFGVSTEQLCLHAVQQDWCLQGVFCAVPATLCMQAVEQLLQGVCCTALHHTLLIQHIWNLRLCSYACVPQAYHAL
jgi:hypothetical protein